MGMSSTCPLFDSAMRHLPVFAVVLLAALLRAANLLQIEHNVDHAYPVWQALRTLHVGEWPILGQWTWLPLPHPALTGYLYAPLLALTQTALSAYVLVIALNTLAVYLAYRALRGLLNPSAALVAALLMAVNPWLIEYSRMSWPPALLPFFSSALLWQLAPVFIGQARRPIRRLLLGAILLALLSQTTLIALLVYPAIGLLIVLFWQRLPKRALAWSALIVALPWAVYGLASLGQAERIAQQWQDFRQISDAPSFRPEAWTHAARLVTGRDYAFTRATHPSMDQDDVQRRQQAEPISSALLDAALLVGLGLSAWAALHHSPQRNAAIILLIWFGAPVLLLSYNASLLHPYYALASLPAGYGLAAWGLHATWKRWPALARPIGLGLLLIGALNGLNSLRYYEETRLTPAVDGLGALPLEWGLRLGDAVRNQLTEGMAVYADVDEWTLNSLAGRVFTVYRNARPAALRLPSSSALLVWSGQADLPAGQRLQNLILPDGQLEVWRLAIPAALPSGFVDCAVTGEGVELLACRLEQDGAHLRLGFIWRVGDPSHAVGRAYVPTVHLIDEAGQNRGIYDGQSVPSAQWQAGDWLVQQVELSLPGRGPYRLSVGLFDGVAQHSLGFRIDETRWDTLIPLWQDIPVHPTCGCADRRHHADHHQSGTDSRR